jgi:hypothetical protein
MLILEHADGRTTYINPSWDSIWANDPVFNCLARDMQLSRRALLRLLNEVHEGS